MGDQINIVSFSSLLNTISPSFSGHASIFLQNVISKGFDDRLVADRPGPSGHGPQGLPE
jgi:hypothetical protein